MPKCQMLNDECQKCQECLRPATRGRRPSLHRWIVLHPTGQGKLELCPGSGGWSDPKPGSKEERGLPDVQLYDLTADISERRNLQAEQPDVTARLTALLQNYVDNGRSTPGTPQKNDRNVTIAPPKPKPKAAQTKKAEK